MALATPSGVLLRRAILRIAWAGARAGVLRMESLLAMGILMAYGYSAAVAFCRRHARLLRYRLRPSSPWC